MFEFLFLRALPPIFLHQIRIITSTFTTKVFETMNNIKSMNNRSKQDVNVVSLEKGRLPPQDIELEQVVLGAMMIDKKAVDDVIDFLQDSMFYREEHRLIYKAIYDLFQDSEPIDLRTIVHKLRTEGNIDRIGGEYYVVMLSQKVASSAHTEYHARIVQQLFIKRCLISISAEIAEKSYNDTIDVFDLLDTAESKLFEVTQRNLKKGSEVAEGLVKQAIKKIEDFAHRSGMSGVPSGFSRLDEITSGWQDSDLVIIAARPGMGKTAFVMSMAKNMSIGFDIPVAIFSLEMSSVQLITRMISSETGISSEKLRKGSLEPHEWELLNVKVKNLSKAPIFIDDTPSLSIFDLRAKARRLVSQHNIKILVIDYLQLMTTGSSANGNREQEISTISRNLKSLAKELDIPILALSQLSRAVETRGGSKRPLLSDLRDSGAIEQDADIVSFIYRPEYYGNTEWDDDERSPCEGQAEFIVAKHRNGGLDNIRLKFTGHLALFSDLENGPNNEFESKMNIDMTTSPRDAFGNDGEENGMPF